MKFKPVFLLVLLSFAANNLLAQAPSFSLLAKADSLYKARNYQLSVKTYEVAFKNRKPIDNHYYNAACSAALAGEKKKAFQFLDKAIETGWTDVQHLKKDSDLNALHKEKAWPKMLTKLEEKVAKLEANYDKPLQAELLQIFDQDQQIRHVYLKAANELGYNHPKVDSLEKIMARQDQENQQKVMAILDKYGWVGPERVGPLATQTLFLVIQHSDKTIQEKYLPMMREAAKQGKLSNSSLALLEDRVALAQGKKQLYGSQIGRDEKIGRASCRERVQIG